MEYLSPESLGTLFRAFHAETSPMAERNHLCALTCLFTGARISQVLALRGTDLFRLDGRYVLQIGKAKRGYNGIREVQTNPDPAFDMQPLVAMAAIRQSSKLFGSLDRFQFDDILKRVGRKAGIHEGFLHSHMFRHSAAMVVFDNTQRIGAVSQFLLHRAPSSAFAYLAENDGKRAQAAINSIQLS